jgi:hypothetical protein
VTESIELAKYPVIIEFSGLHVHVKDAREFEKTLRRKRPIEKHRCELARFLPRLNELTDLEIAELEKLRTRN